MPRRRDDLELVLTDRRRARPYQEATARSTGDVGLGGMEQQLLTLQKQAGNQAVLQALTAPRWTARAEEGTGGAEDAEDASDWSLPIEDEADTRAERSVHQHGDAEGRVASSRDEPARPTTVPLAVQRQAVVTFPTFAQVRWNATVSNAMWAAWAATLRTATRTTRREQGFWVQWDNTTTRNANGDMRVVGAVTAPAVAPTVTASVQLGARPADAGAWVTVASFHTHTPTRHRPVGRVVGPSAADGAADTSDNVTGLVYDYTAVAGGAIPAGHPTWSSAQVYHSGPNART